MKRAIVTGSTGCVGRNVIQTLARDGGWEIFATYRDINKRDRVGSDNGVIPTRIDLLNDPMSYIARKLPHKIDAIFHCAGDARHWPLIAKEQSKNNIEFTAKMLSIYKWLDAKRFIYTSTGATNLYGKIKSNYVDSKYKAAQLVKDASNYVDWVMISPAVIVGEYDFNNYSQLIVNAYHKQPSCIIPGVMGFNDATEIGLAHLNAFYHGEKYYNYIPDSWFATWEQFYDNVGEVIEKDIRKIKIGLTGLRQMAHVQLWLSYISKRMPLLTPELIDLLGYTIKHPLNVRNLNDEFEKTREDLKYEVQSLVISIDRCYNWLKNSGRLTQSG